MIITYRMVGIEKHITRVVGASFGWDSFVVFFCNDFAERVVTSQPTKALSVNSVCKNY